MTQTHKSSMNKREQKAKAKQFYLLAKMMVKIGVSFISPLKTFRVSPVTVLWHNAIDVIPSKSNTI
ncbi:CLUMA_CG010997, isoform A [Clunio marinus]|uniref:CLUMA_CG010997, isoform A n=1 Tax=Clunio marinus TaxID=568069 RepID=A0A1J1IBM3_9DIPT|nr:CLUMA_CG010997, isoform A [Clunio marinus]